MKIDIITLFPEMYDGFVSTSIIKRAIESNLVEINVHNFREYTKDKHLHVDDTPYGGGAGMLLSVQPVIDCLKAIKTIDSHVLLMSPQGPRYTQSKAEQLTNYNHLIIICGHYEGYDERIREYVDEEISIGDYVLTGGELASQIVCDSIIRLLDGAIKEVSHQDDSYSSGLLEYPQYTRPFEYDGKVVPEVLLSGHHENIRKWRLYKSLEKTYRVRPDLIEQYPLTKEMEIMLEEIKSK